MATKRSRTVTTGKRRAKKVRTPRSESKAAFVRAFGPDAPAKAVIAAAKERGLVLTAGYVYAVRSRGLGTSGAAVASARTSPGALTPAVGRSTDRALVDAIVAVGTRRAREVLDLLEREIGLITHAR